MYAFSSVTKMVLKLWKILSDYKIIIEIKIVCVSLFHVKMKDLFDCQMIRSKIAKKSTSCWALKIKALRK